MGGVYQLNFSWPYLKLRAGTLLAIPEKKLPNLPHRDGKTPHQQPKSKEVIATTHALNQTPGACPEITLWVQCSLIWEPGTKFYRK